MDLFSLQWIRRNNRLIPQMISNGEVPEMYYYVMMRWSPWNGNNYFDIDMDGDSLINGIDVDMDADGMPDWWDQDEGS